MQETTAQFAFDRLSQEGAGPSGAAASLDTSEKRLQALVSQIAVARAPAGQAASDGHDTSSTTAAAGGPAPSATPDQVQKAYADA